MLDIGLHLMMLFPSNLKDPFFHPIGIPSGSSSFDDTGENYPRHTRILAPTTGYQRFLVEKSLYIRSCIECF